MIKLAKIKMTPKKKQMISYNLMMKKQRLIKTNLWQITVKEICKQNQFSNHLYLRWYLINPNRSVLRV